MKKKPSTPPKGDLVLWLLQFPKGATLEMAQARGFVEQDLVDAESKGFVHSSPRKRRWFGHEDAGI